MDYFFESALIPSYLTGFKCIGRKCKDTCCRSWSIGVDKDAYDKYLKLEAGQKSPVFTAHLKRIPDNIQSNDYAYIEMVDGICPFLTDDGLCGIHLEYGPGYLTGSCNTYPRIINILNDSCEISGLTSCPEMARLVLLNSSKIEFYQVEIKNHLKNDLFISTILNFNTRKGQWAFFTLELRDFAIRILQERSCSLMDRLLFLGLFFQEVQKLINNSEIEAIPKLITQHLRMMKNGGVQNISTGIKPNIPLQYIILKEIGEIRIADCPEYEGFFLRVLNGTGYLPQNNLDTNIDNYIRVYLTYYNQYMNEKEFILENYLVNFIYNSVFPYNENKDNIFESYIAFVINFALLRFHLVGMAGLKQQLNDELIINTLYLFSRFIRHDRGFINKICKILEEKNIASLAHLALLMKAP